MGIRDRLRRLVSSPKIAPSANRWLLDLSALRDGQIYAEHFGQPWRMSIEPMPLGRLSSVVTPVDPRWAHTGVYAFPPDQTRQTWLQVTSGLSNPWHGPMPPPMPSRPSRARSGAGMELCLLTPQRSTWASDTLNALMAQQQVIAASGGTGRLQVGDVVPLSSLALHRSPPPPAGLCALLATTLVGLPDGFALPYGQVSLILMVGMTDLGESHPDLMARTGGITPGA